MTGPLPLSLSFLACTARNCTAAVTFGGGRRGMGHGGEDGDRIRRRIREKKRRRRRNRTVWTRTRRLLPPPPLLRYCSVAPESPMYCFWPWRNVPTWYREVWNQERTFWLCRCWSANSIPQREKRPPRNNKKTAAENGTEESVSRRRI